jgi:hypothetical protein
MLTSPSVGLSAGRPALSRPTEKTSRSPVRGETSTTKYKKQLKQKQGAKLTSDFLKNPVDVPRRPRACAAGASNCSAQREAQQTWGTSNKILAP